MRIFTLALTLTLIPAALLADIYVRRNDGITVYGKWKCGRNGFVAYSDKERDDYIAAASKSSAPFTLGDFTNILPDQETIDLEEKKALSVEDKLAIIAIKVENLEKK